MKLSDLMPNTKNPRKITNDKLRSLEESMETFGDLGGCVYNKTTKRLVTFHQRQKTLPADSKIIITKKYKKPTSDGTVEFGVIEVKDKTFSYRGVQWDEATEKAAMLRANNSAGEWDMGLLPDILLDLDSNNMKLDLTGFDLPAIEDILAPLDKKTKQMEKEDKIPEAKESVCKLGDLWVLGNHRLLCGDSTDIKQVERLMNGEKADMVFTDPPYGLDWSGGTWASKAHIKDARRWDKKIDQETINKLCIFGKQVVLWGGNYYEVPPSRCWLSWKKTNSNKTMSDFELAWTNMDKCCKQFESAHTLDGKRQHATQKPVALAEWAFSLYDSPKTVLDLFGGSGSTLIACEKTNRKCFMMELDPHYCDVIIKRWEEYTGQKAVLSKS